MSALDTLRNRVGQELGISEWLLIDQARVDQHAQVTGDAQWIHNDPERATKEGPFGGPIVQGFLLLALFTELSTQAIPAGEGLDYLINYGFDRVRFLRPVRVGSRVRLRVSLGEVRAKDESRAVLAMDVVLETEGHPEPAVAARWLFLAQAS